MIVIAHRGANREAPENSRKAFDLAVECGAHRLEIDVWLSKDHVPFVVHDKDLERSCGMRGLIAETDSDLVKKLRLKNGEALPLLGDILEEYLPKIEINIELKGTDTQLAKVVSKILEANKWLERITLSAFSYEMLQAASTWMPKIKRACLTAPSSIYWPYFVEASPVCFAQFCNTPIVHPEVSQVGESFMEQAFVRGWTVYPWVPLDGEESDKELLWMKMYDLGVHGLCTNYPRELVIWLKSMENLKFGMQNLEHVSEKIAN